MKNSYYAHQFSELWRDATIRVDPENWVKLTKLLPLANVSEVNPSKAYRITTNLARLANNAPYSTDWFICHYSDAPDIVVSDTDCWLLHDGSDGKAKGLSWAKDIGNSREEVEQHICDYFRRLIKIAEDVGALDQVIAEADRLDIEHKVKYAKEVGWLIKQKYQLS